MMSFPATALPAVSRSVADAGNVAPYPTLGGTLSARVVLVGAHNPPLPASAIASTSAAVNADVKTCSSSSQPKYDALVSARPPIVIDADQSAAFVRVPFNCCECASRPFTYVFTRPAS